MDALFEAFITNGSTENWAALRAAHLNSPEFDACSDGLWKLGVLIERGHWTRAYEVLERLGQLGQKYLLSPRYYLYAWRILDEVGMHEMARYECNISHWMLKVMLDSGDGSMKRPFLVTREEDIVDIFHKHLKRKPATWSPFFLFDQESQRVSYQVTCTDGTVLYFETGIAQCHKCERRLCYRRPVLH